MYYLYEESGVRLNNGVEEMIWSRRANRNYSATIVKETDNEKYSYDIHNEISNEKLFETDYIYNSFNEAVDAAEDYITTHDLSE